MLYLLKIQTIKGLSVYEDDKEKNTFYIVPNSPRFRLDDNGLPVFKFLKYRSPIERGDGKKGGGFCFFDVEFAVTAEERRTVEEELKKQLATTEDPKIGVLSYIEGSASLQLMSKDNVLIESVLNPGKPSLYGKNVTSFALELSPEGATLFKEALQGGGGVVQVIYHLTSWARLPGVDVTITYDQDKAYKYWQEIKETQGDWIWREGKYEDTLEETLTESGAGHVEYSWGAIEDEDTQKKVRSWAEQTLAEAVKQQLQIDTVAADDRGSKAEGGVTKTTTQNIDIKKSSSFKQTYSENMAIKWEINPQGTVPNITTIKDDPRYFTDVDLNDDFFKQLIVAVQVNADFERLPLYGVVVHLDYQGEIRDFAFHNADDIGKFAAYIKDDRRDYTYKYRVAYKGKSRHFESGPQTDNFQVLTIGVDDVGMLLVDVIAGNLDFEKTDNAQVSFRYEDAENDIKPIERQFIIDKENTQHKIQEILFAPRNKPYQYRIDYFMKDGKRYAVDWQESKSDQLYVNSPFHAIKTVQVRGVNLKDIETIYLDIKYREEANDYSRIQSCAISEAKIFFNWEVRQIDPMAGKVTYSGSIARKDGTTQAIPETETKRATILVGDIIAGTLKITVDPALLDDEAWNKIRLVKVTLIYEDEANDVREQETVTLRKGVTEPQSWKVQLKDKSLRTCSWQAEYYMVDGSRKKTDWQTDTDIFPDPMAVL